MGLGIAGLAMLLIVGIYSFSRPLPRILCLAGLVLWFGLFVVMAVIHRDINMLAIPSIVVLGWMALHAVLKD